MLSTSTQNADGFGELGTLEMGPLKCSNFHGFYVKLSHVRLSCVYVCCVPQVLHCAHLILSSDSAARRAELEAMEVMWDGEVRAVSKYCTAFSVGCIF